MAVLLAVVAATRWPLLSNRAGEPDCGLFIEGIWRWLSYGPAVGEIYGKNLSAGYYWGLAAAIHGLGTASAHYPHLMNLISLGGALAAAPLAYLIGRRLLPPMAAFCATLVFVCEPSLWWLGIEPHPQGPAITLFLASVWLFLKAWGAGTFPQPAGRGRRWPHAGWTAAMVAGLTGALLLRADHVLMFLAYPALLWAVSTQNLPPGPAAGPQAPEAPVWRWRAWESPLAVTLGMLAAASVIFVLLRQSILQQSLAATNAYSRQQTAGYIAHGVQLLLSRLPYVLKQLLPMASTLGLLAWAVALAAAIWGWRQWGGRWAGRWLVLWAGWSAVGYVFWFLVLGNNIRHVALLGLPLLWWAADAARRRLPPAALAAAAAAIVLLDPLVIPPSSNITVYASANVPASWRMLRQRQAELRRIATAMTAVSTRPEIFALRGAAPACFLGSYSTPYVLSDLLLSTGQLAAPGVVGMRIGHGWSDVLLGGAPGRPQRWIRLYEIYSPTEYRHLRPRCQAAFSVEYTPQSYHQRFLGKEWRTVPLLNWFYPPHPNAVVRPPPAPAPSPLQ